MPSKVGTAAEPHEISISVGSGEPVLFTLYDRYDDGTLVPAVITGLGLELTLERGTTAAFIEPLGQTRVSSTPTDGKLTISVGVDGIVKWIPRFLPQTALGTALKVKSSSVADTQKVVLTGYNSDGVKILETVTLNGTTYAAGSSTWGQMESIRVVGAHAGFISVAKTSDSTVIGIIPILGAYIPELIFSRGFLAAPMSCRLSQEQEQLILARITTTATDAAGTRRTYPSGEPIAIKLRRL